MTSKLVTRVAELTQACSTIVVVLALEETPETKTTIRAFLTYARLILDYVEQETGIKEEVIPMGDTRREF